MSQGKIVIVDYGMGNLRSVQKALERVGGQAEISGDKQRLAHSDKLILPGVGAFRDAMHGLREAGLIDPIREHTRKQKPFLGICLGLQLLFDRSFEDGETPGLGILPGDVVRFAPQPGLKIPHMGWNTLNLVGNCPLFAGLPPQPAVYFVHSYYPVPRDHLVIAATSDYPEPFTCAVWKGPILATQFHPEKSQAVGLTMLRNFVDL